MVKMLQNLKIGEKVLIELHTNEIFEGLLKNKTQKFIELIQTVVCHCDEFTITELTNQTKYESNLKFFIEEIKTISQFKEETQNNVCSESPKKQQPSPKHSEITMCELDFNWISERLKCLIIIDTSNSEDYTEAIYDLANAESISLIGFGANFNINRPLSVLMMCTFSHYYVFDMFKLKKFREIKDILETKDVLKVLHNATALYECLYHQYGIEIKNIYDTQVADTMLSKMEENVEIERDLSQCLSYRFNFPLSLLSVSLYEFHDQYWQERPLAASQLVGGAQLCVFLLNLRSKLERLMLKDFYCAVDDKYDRHKDKPVFDLKKKTN